MAKSDDAADKLKLTGVDSAFLDATAPKAIAPSKTDDPHDGLDMSVFDGRSAAITKCIEWVAETLALDDVDPATAPSALAWGMRSWARSTSQTTDEFWKSFVAKLVPSRANLEADEARHDDGRKLDGLEDDLLRIRENALKGARG